MTFKYLTGNNQGKPFWVLSNEDAMGHQEDLYPGELARIDETHFMWLVDAVKNVVEGYRIRNVR